ncbi:MAG TPA: 16S rRNA (adenine(1518)-N(6)/adenine(1519)-N(6))-dimethyltransferase RsmA [Syntrophomonadaceae bacterium]|nr:16S rRNA (adenine(1518)-N(6)/adenine(1519)-N(6))-dimethyltransferase RsmA [Syntrophomonadaceae bacterium]
MLDIATPSGVRHIMQHYGIKPKKTLGQNFLVDKNIIKRIVESTGLQADQWVVEIGPGLGAMTKELAEHAAGVLAIDIDHTLEPVLSELTTEYNNINLFFQDILKVDIEQQLCALSAAEECPPYQVCANIPYHITSPIIFKLFKECTHMQAATLMIQKEVSERLLAQPGTRDYGRLTVTSAYYADIHLVTKVSRNCFYPRPEVDSAVIKLLPRRSLILTPEQEAVLDGLIREAFQKRRKTILNIVSSYFGIDKKVTEAKLQELGIAKNLRPENLALQDYAKLVDAFSSWEANGQ